MGGGKVKRRFVDVWACSDACEETVELSEQEPELYGYGGFNCKDGSMIDPGLFRLLTGIAVGFEERLEPIRVRIPVWAVLTA